MDNRQQSVKPLVDVFFAGVKDILDNKSISSTNLKAVLNYSVNQEIIPWSESIPDCCKQLKKDN